MVILTVSSSALFSCTNAENETTNNGGGTLSSVAIVVPTWETTEAKDTFYKFYYALGDALSATPAMIPSTDSERDHEIVFGQTDRAVSEAAYDILERMTLTAEEEQEGRPRVLIYSDGSSLAVAYDSYEDDVALIRALNYLNSIDITESLWLDEGIVYTEVVDVSAYYQAIDDAMVELKWSELSTAIGGELGDEVVASFKQLYSLYTDDLVSWFADLYDPAIGGYYYSNSARNTDGYLPDAESTEQALRFINDSGMIDSFASDYSKALPAEMGEAIVNFIYNLQDPNGYFYHPQWAKAAVDNKVSRRSRDLGWCVSILSHYGVTPRYKTPSGVGSSELEPVSRVSLTERLRRASVSAVSKVLAVADSAVAVDPNLQDDESFLKYLDSLNVQTNSYSAGNTLTSFYNEIKYRDQILAAEGADYSLVDIMIEYLNDKQFDNGLWHAEVNYYAINGLMKISGVYSKAGVPLPNSEKATRAAIDAITSDEVPGAVTSIYNTWYAVNRMFNLMSNYDGEAGKARVTEMRVELLAKAPEAIKVTAEKLSVFRKTDGSFSYNPDSSSQNSQGMPAAVPNTNEGDVNATIMCTSDILNYIYSALGLGKYRVPIYTYNDWRTYSSILAGLGPVIKDEEMPIYEPITFDEDLVTEEPDVKYLLVSSRSKSNGGGASIIVDERDGHSGNLLEVVSVAGTSDSLDVETPNLSHAFSCFAFEGDFCLVSSDTDFPVRISVGECYTISLKVSDGHVRLVQSTSETSSKSQETILCDGPALGEWFSLKVEYYKGSHDTVRIKFYFDGNLDDGKNLELVAVTDGYYDEEGTKFIEGYGEPATQYSSTNFWFMKGYNIVMLMDNLASYKSNDTYNKYTDTKNPLKLNVDAPIPESGDDASDTPAYTDTYYNHTSIAGSRYDYSEKLGKEYIYNKKYDSKTYQSTTSIPTATTVSGGKLNVSNLSNYNGVAIANFSENKTGVTGAKYVFEADFKWLGGAQSSDQIADGAAFIGFLGEHTAVDNVQMSAVIYLSFIEGDNSGILLGGNRLEKGVAYNIRIEYTVGGSLKLYIDNVEAENPPKVLNGKNSDSLSYESFGMYFRKGFTDALSFTLDNVYLGVISPEDIENIPIVPTVPEEPEEPEIPDEPVTKPYYSYYTDSSAEGLKLGFTGSTQIKHLWTNNNSSSVHVTPSTVKIADGVLSETTTSWNGFAIASGDTAEYASAKYVFEADFTLNKAVYRSTGSIIMGFLADTEGEVKLMSNKVSFFDGYLAFPSESDLSTYTVFGADKSLEVGTTYNLRFIYDTETNSTDIYVDNVKITTVTEDKDASGKNNVNVLDSKFIGFTFYPRINGVEFTLDNVYLGVVDGVAAASEETVTLLDTPTGADSTVVVMHDDGDLNTMAIIDQVLKEYGLRGNIALLGNKIYTGTYGSGSYNTSAIAKWQAYLNTGRWQISSHSMTHSWWGLTNEAEDTYIDINGNAVACDPPVYAGMITDEVENSQKVLKEAFPTQRVLTFAYPGFWAQRYIGEDRFSAVARLIVEKFYIAGRDSYGNSYVDTGDTATDWKFAPSWQLDASNLTEILSVLEGIGEGKMAVIFTHKVATDDTATLGSNTMYEKDFRTFAAKISELQTSGKVWCAFYEDAILYAREKQNASLTFTEETDKITVTLTTQNLDTEIYNYPLTVRVLTPDAWEAVKITQNGTTSYALVKTVDGKRCINASIVPNGGDAVIEQAALSDMQFYTYYGDESIDGNRYAFEDGNVPSAVIMNNDKGTSADTVSVVTDSVGNKLLSETSTGWHGFAFLSGDDTAYTSGKYVFETDFTMTKAVYKDTTGSAFFGFITYADQIKNGSVICEDTTNNAAAFADFYLKVSSDATTYTWFGYTLDVGATYNIRTVYDVESNTVSVYINDALVTTVSSYATSPKSDSVFRGFMFYPRIGGYEFTLDNVFIGVVNGVAAS